MFNTITGSPVKGQNHFNISGIEEKFWQKVQNENIFISAPRRVGKTSFMQNISENMHEGFECIFLDVEAINNSNEFYKKIYKALIEKLKGIQYYWRQVAGLIKSNRISAINLEGAEIEYSERDYFEELPKLIQALKIVNRIIIMLDEFPQVIQNIWIDEGETSARKFIQSNRELRQMPEIYSKLRFVYTGSIGLENIVSELNSIQEINDLYPFKIPPLTKNQAKEFIRFLSKNNEDYFTNENLDYLFDKIVWLIPFYIQLVLDAIEDLLREDEGPISKEIIDKAINEIIGNRNRFEHWFTRLRIFFKGKQLNFIKEVLSLASNSKNISKAEIFNLAVKFDLENEYYNLINALVHDGYLNNIQNENIYVFNSPILKLWWKKNVAV